MANAVILWRLAVCPTIGMFMVLNILLFQMISTTVSKPPKTRRLGVGIKLLEYILKTAKEDGCARATLHVQTNNVLALKFYEKGGFTVTETVPGYYKNIEPTDAHVLEKEL